MWWCSTPTLFYVPPPLCPCNKLPAVLWNTKNSPHRPTQTGSENRVALALALERVGSRERIHEGTLDQQYRDALESGDELAAKRLKDQVPGVHIGPHNVARAERGVVLERPATAQVVEDGNQELKSDREEVEKMEGMLWRARAMVVQVAKQLAGKVRERFERSRGRDGPDHGWSR